jgi:ABC-type lipoprotein export system ATPase subunit
VRNPVTALAGNLILTRGGTWWSVWRLSPLPYGYRPAEAKRRVRSLHSMLLRGLRGDSLLLGLCAQLDPYAVVERMIDGVDLEEHPAWAAECEATLDRLESIPLGERSYWLALPAQLHGSEWVRNPLRAAAGELVEQLGLPAGRPTLEEIEVAQSRAAAAVRASVPAPFHPRPATAAEMSWLAEHARRRGLPEFPLPAPGDEVEGIRAGYSYNLPLLDEGGQSEMDRTTWQRINPLARRFLKVSDALAVGDGSSASYQCALVLDDVPAGGMSFPGSEYLGRLDETGLAVDWAIRLTMRPSTEATRKIRRAVRDLNDQFSQRDGTLSTGLHELDRAAENLTAYEQALTADRNETGGEATVMLYVGADTAEGAQAQASELARYMAAAEYRLSQPVGDQETLWWAAQAGVPTARPVRQLAQTVTAHDLAAAVPLASVEVGDRKGVAFALNISSLTPHVVHLDLESSATQREESPALAIAGSLGSGKSVAIKTIAGALVDRGGRLLTIDRSASGEWGHLARTLTSAEVVDVSSPTVSLDPLRLFPGPVGARVTQSFLSTLLNCPATSPLGCRLSDVLDSRYLAAEQLRSLGDLAGHLDDSTDPQDQQLASYLRTFARKDLGQVLFDGNLPVLDLSARAIVIGTAGLQLPSREELLHEHLFRSMRLERIFGRAVYTLAVGVIRSLAFARPDEMAVVPLDEAHHVTASPESQAEVVELVRDGRKHQAAVLLASHDPEADFGSDTLQGLIPTRIAGRQSDPELARKSLRWLGLDPDDAELVEMLVRDTSPVNESTGQVPEGRRGEALMRDSRGRIGRIKILPPASPVRAQAVLTTPGSTRHRDGAPS